MLRGEQPDAGGGLRSWSAELTNGRHFLATASNGFMSGISQSPSIGLTLPLIRRVPKKRDFVILGNKRLPCCGQSGRFRFPSYKITVKLFH